MKPLRSLTFFSRVSYQRYKIGPVSLSALPHLNHLMYNPKIWHGELEGLLGKNTDKDITFSK